MTQHLTFSTQLTAADSQTRTISGTVVTFGEVGNTSAGPAMFEAGSITHAGDVVLRLEHDRTRPIGRAVELAETKEAITGSFKIVATRSGDDSLVEAAEGLRSGFSVGVSVDAAEERDGVLVVTAATLEEVSLVTHPAIQSAQVTEVAASEAPTDPDPSTEEPVIDTEEGDTVDQSTETVAEVTAAVPSPIMVQDAFPYREGVQASFFRDMYNSRLDVEAARRVAQAQEMLSAAQKTTNVAQVIPPGYRPDMYIGEESLGRPVASTFSKFSISDATPFKIPVFNDSAATGLIANHVEGTNPTDGAIGFTEITVSPKAVSGKFTASREMLDAANPALDAIILKAMREAYEDSVETMAADALIAAASAGGNAAGGKVTVALVNALATFTGTRRLPVSHIALGSGYFGKVAAEVDGSGRPLNPYLSPSNADGSVGAAIASLNVAGIAARQAWSLIAKQAVVYRGSDFGLFESPRLSWRWEEQAGPANIVFAQFAYCATTNFNAAGAVKFTDGTA